MILCYCKLNQVEVSSDCSCQADMVLLLGQINMVPTHGMWPLISGMHSFYLNQQRGLWDFPGGAVVENPPANAGHTGSSPGPGGSHMSQSS